MRTAYKTEAAQVASIIKNELKAKFPGTKFSVKSETYSGGDSVNVYYAMTDETSPKRATIEAIVNKYQAGHFNGMEDIYEYTNKTEGKTVKYAFVNVDTRILEEKYKQAFLDSYGLTAFDDAVIMPKLGMWKEQALHRYITNVVLSK